MEIRKDTHRGGKAGDDADRGQPLQNVRTLDAGKNSAQREQRHRDHGSAQAKCQWALALDDGVDHPERQHDEKREVERRHGGDRGRTHDPDAAFAQQLPPGSCAGREGDGESQCRRRQHDELDRLRLHERASGRSRRYCPQGSQPPGTAMAPVR